MSYTLLGCLAFVIVSLSDLAALKDVPYAKQGIGLVSVLLFSFAVVQVSLSGEKLPLPLWLSWAGWPLLVTSLCLLIYSLFVEIPFKQTYARPGVGDRLVKTGTYALTRHPGILWLGLFLLALLAVTRSKLLLIAVPLWLALDLLLVWAQDRFYFPRMFPGYSQYQHETPMLIPTRNSIVRCIETLHPERRGPIVSMAVPPDPEHKEEERC
jgi:protein-S-isoprenylcysteine O-methyltransferase Ste14